MLALIPLTVYFHCLRLRVLYAVVFGIGCLTVLFDVSYQSFVPSVVNYSDLVEGNSKLESTRALSGIAGTAIGGILVQWLTAPFALLVDAGSYFVSVLSLVSIGSSETVPTPPSEQNVWRQMREGLTFVLRHPFLRSIVISTALSNFFSGITEALMVLFAVHGIGMNASLLGTVFAVNAVGAAMGAFVGGRLGKWLGIGWGIIVAEMLVALGGWLLPLAHRPIMVGFSLFIASGVLVSFGSVVFNVNQVSARQTITPPHLLGRMTASVRFIIWGIMPFGSLVGGILGAQIGLRPTLVISAIGGVLPVLWSVFSPIRTMKSVGTPSEP